MVKVEPGGHQHGEVHEEDQDKALDATGGPSSSSSGSEGDSDNEEEGEEEDSDAPGREPLSAYKEARDKVLRARQRRLGGLMRWVMTFES